MLNLPSATLTAPILTTLSLAGTVTFVALVAALHLLRTDQDPTARFVSQYAVGDYGSLMVVAFLALGGGSLALSLELMRRGGALPVIVALLLAVWGVAMIAAAIFPTDPPEAAATTRIGELHRDAARIGFGAVLIATLLFGAHSLFASEASGVRPWALLLAAAALVTYLALRYGSTGEFAGLIQRGYLAVIVAWLVMLAIHLQQVRA